MHIERQIAHLCLGHELLVYGLCCLNDTVPEVVLLKGEARPQCVSERYRAPWGSAPTLQCATRKYFLSHDV